jgi:hypothetical protein
MKPSPPFNKRDEISGFLDMSCRGAAASKCLGSTATEDGLVSKIYSSPLNSYYNF